MDIKKFFAALLTLLGIIGLIYAAYIFVSGKGDWKEYLVLFVLGLIFFSAGIRLINSLNNNNHPPR